MEISFVVQIAQTHFFFLSIGTGFRFSIFWNNKLLKGYFQDSSG
jgi:hypothetical protein